MGAQGRRRLSRTRRGAAVSLIQHWCDAKSDRLDLAYEPLSCVE